MPKPAHPGSVDKLRIAIISDAISGRNGVGTYYLDLIHQLRPHVDEVTLIAPQNEPEWALEAFACPMPGDPTQRVAWPRRGALSQKLDELQPHILILPTIGPFSFFALRYAKRKNLPLALVNHTNFDQLMSLYWPKWISWPLRQALGGLNWWMYSQAKAVAAMSDESLQQMGHSAAKRGSVLGTPLDKEFLSEPIQPMPDYVSKAIFLGRLAREKGLEQILEAVRELPKVHFTIAGDGPLKEKVQMAASEYHNLTYLGWLPRSRVREEIDAAEILLLPSAYETFGTVALEALARRRLVVVSSHCGISRWPSIAGGLFQITANKTLSAVIMEIQKMPAEHRNRHAEKSWQAVPDFNGRVACTWLDFLVDAAALG